MARDPDLMRSPPLIARELTLRLPTPCRDWPGIVQSGGVACQVYPHVPPRDTVPRRRQVARTTQ